MDSSNIHRALSLLNPAVYFYSNPALSGGTGWTREQRLGKHSPPALLHSALACNQKIIIASEHLERKASDNKETQRHIFPKIKLTSRPPVYTVDSVVHKTTASLLNLPDNCHSGQALLDRTGWSLKPRPQTYNECLTVDSHIVCK